MADNNEDELVDYDEEEVRREIAARREATTKQHREAAIGSFVRS